MFKKSLFLILFFHASVVLSAQSFLVDINWLQKNMNSSTVRIIDMSDDTQFQRFHIPGSTHLPYSAINQRNKKGVSFSAGSNHVIKILGFLGVQAQDHIVIYDDMGGLHAARLFWELEKIGHKKVSILNGGLVTWILAGKKVTAETKKTKPVQYVANNKSNRNNVASLDDILKTKFNNKNILLDVRSKDEYVGHPRNPRGGHIPKARWWEWSQAVNFENAFKMQDSANLKKQLAKVGISNTTTPVTLYCQSAHRAAQSYFTLRQLGYQNVKVYDGSMSEYSKVKSAPLTKGLNP